MITGTRWYISLVEKRSSPWSLCISGTKSRSIPLLVCFKNVFLHSELEKEEYRDMPPRPPEEGVKAEEEIWGLEHTSRAWLEKYTKAIFTT